MKSYNTLILSVIVILALGQSAHANEPVPMKHGAPSAGMEPGPGRHGMRRDMMPQRRGYAQVILDHADELKLTDEQVGKITRIHQENQARAEELGKKLHESMRETHEAFLNPASDEAAIKQKAQAHTTAFNEFLATALKLREAVNTVLTPSQRDQSKSLKPAGN
jgi:Spy/CpxP family protein refolding chaperone